MDPVERLIAAWTDPGPRPEVHDAAKRRLRADWPTLAYALDDLTVSAPQRAEAKSMAAVLPGLWRRPAGPGRPACRAR